MIAISNSSPLIALSSIDRLVILAQLFERVIVPTAVYEETVIENPVLVQSERIARATASIFDVITPQNEQQFVRTLGKGERGVLNLALELHPDVVILDDKKARNEAIALNLIPIFTADVLRLAAEQQLIPSYQATIAQLAQLQIYLPESPHAK